MRGTPRRSTGRSLRELRDATSCVQLLVEFVEAPNRRQPSCVERFNDLSNVRKRPGCPPAHTALNSISLRETVQHFDGCLASVERPDSVRIHRTLLVVVVDRRVFVVTREFSFTDPHEFPVSIETGNIEYRLLIVLVVGFDLFDVVTGV